MPAPGLDAERIIETLRDHRVLFVVVGGFAVELWDVAIPPTIDIDITPELSSANLRRLAGALDELDAGLRVGHEVVSIPGGWTPEMLAQVEVLNLVTSAGPLDLTMVPAGTEGYRDLIGNARELEFGSVMVPTASLEDVAKSKEAAGRSKDLRALPAILAHIARRQAR